MPEHAIEEKLHLKDLLVLTPVYGGALAITFDVGYFKGLDLGYFTFFSFSEHLVFALQALPFALFVAAYIPLMYVAYQMGYQRSTRSPPHVPTDPNTPIEQLVRVRDALRRQIRSLSTTQILFSVLLLVLAIFLYVSSILSAAAFFAILGLISVLDGFLPSIITPRLAIVLYAFGALVVSYFLGQDMAHWFLQQSNSSHNITLADQEIKVLLVRSGERGLLVYEPTSKKISFLIWLDIKKVSSSKQ